MSIHALRRSLVITSLKVKFRTILMTGLADKVQDVMITLILLGVCIPIGMIFFINANKTGWGSELLLIWNYLPIIAFISILIALLMYGLKQ